MFTIRVSLCHTTMFRYSHANTPLGQSERAYYLSYFIIIILVNSVQSIFISQMGLFIFQKTSISLMIKISILHRALTFLIECVGTDEVVSIKY